MIEVKPEFYRNKKNGKLYIGFGTAFNATNGTDEFRQLMTVYCRADGSDLYIREFNEFLDKFERVDVEIKEGAIG